MGLKLTSNDTIAAWNMVFVPPVVRGCLAWFDFDTDASRFGFNRIIGSAAAQVVGAPIAFPTHARFKSLTNYIKTPIRESMSQTIIVVGRAVNPVGNEVGGGPNSPYYAGNFAGNLVNPPAGVTGNGFGSSLYHGSPTGLHGSGTRVNSTGNGSTSSLATLETDVPQEWAIRAVRVDAAGVTTVFNLTRGLKNDGAAATPRILTDSNILIGGAHKTFSAEVDISSIAFYEEALTDEKIYKIAAVMRMRATRLGIPV